MDAPSRPLALPLVLATAGVLLEVVSGYWDVYSHRVVFVDEDPWWNPAHGGLLTGGLLLVAAVLLWQRRVGHGAPRVLGATGVAAGAVLQLTGAVFNEFWHAFIGPDRPLSPPHVMVVAGMLVALVGLVVALAVLWSDREAAPRDRRLVGGLLVLASAGLWLATVGSSLFVGALFDDPGLRYGTALVIGTAGPVVALAAARAFGRFGLLTLTGAVVAAVNWLLLVGYVGDAPYLPLSLLPFLLVDGIHHGLVRRVGPLATAAAGGALLGLLYNWTYFPFLFGTAVAWPHAPDPSLLGVTLAGALGGLLAHGAVRRTAAWAGERAGPAAAGGEALPSQK